MTPKDWEHNRRRSLEIAKKRNQPESIGPKPGAELKSLLSSLGIVAGPTCSCNAMASKMDTWGAACGDHLPEIVDVMEGEAKARGWKLPPGLRSGMCGLVRLAIWKARRKARL